MDAKDITSTSFGLVIAYLLPGITGLYSLKFWHPMVREVFGKFLNAESNVGLFLIVMLASLILGLHITLFRWLIFECLMCRSYRLNPSDFVELGTEPKLTAFRAAVDEHYRYHQFWGGMCIVLPLGFAGWIKDFWGTLSTPSFFWIFAIFMAVELTTGIGAFAAYTRYVERARRIIKGK